MLLYRICRCMYADDLSGMGSRLYGGRWNSEGHALVYTASSRSLAMLETLVHISPTNVPDDFCMMVIEAPDDVQEFDSSLLPANWQEYPETEMLKTIGNQFLRESKCLMLKVPSAIVKEEFNYLINPMHSKAHQVKVVEKSAFIFDVRLVGSD